jgi:adenylate kinase family enzyme
MKRVMIVGSGGAGKSTLARQLGEVSGMEVIHLDSLFWHESWTPTPAEEWADIVAELVRRDSWIIDGNYGGTREMRLAACDTIIWMDTPRLVCIYRALKRVITYRNRSRPDIAAGCNERLDREFLEWIWNYPRRVPGMKAQFARYPEKRLIVIRSKKDVERLLQAALGSRPPLRK